MDLDALRAAMILAEELHFGRTAQRLFLDPGALTRRIQRLERTLGVTLFERTSRRVRLTHAGVCFLYEATSVLAVLERLKSGLRDAETAGLRVGVFGFGIVDAWKTLRDIIVASRPGVRFEFAELDVTNQVDALRLGMLDVALVHHTGPIDGLHIQPVASMGQVAVVPRASSAASSSTLSRADMSELSWIGYATDDPAFGDWAGPAHPTDPADRCVRSPATMVAAVATTGLAGIHGAAAARYYYRPDVAFVPITAATCRVAVATRHDDTRPLIEVTRAAARLTAERWNPTSDRCPFGQ